MDTAARDIIRQLTARRLTLAVAESCTGGLVGAALTAVPGASECFRGGVIAYANCIKTGLLKVDEALLRQHGAVSDPVARAMAEGAQQALGADLAVSITGIAGPGGGTEDKPVGLVYIGASGLGPSRARRLLFEGTREQIRQHSCRAALELILARLGREGEIHGHQEDEYPRD